MPYAPINLMDVLPVAIFVLAITATVYMSVHPRQPDQPKR